MLVPGIERDRENGAGLPFEGKRITFEWKAGAIFAIPLNAWHQHFNGSGQEPVRYVGVTNAPAVINLYDDTDFIFNTAYDFKNRFAGELDYFTPKAEKNGFLLVTNFVPDAVNLPLISAKERGAGAGQAWRPAAHGGCLQGGAARSAAEGGEPGRGVDVWNLHDAGGCTRQTAARRVRGASCNIGTPG